MDKGKNGKALRCNNKIGKDGLIETTQVLMAIHSEINISRNHNIQVQKKLRISLGQVKITQKSSLCLCLIVSIGYVPRYQHT